MNLAHSFMGKSIGETSFDKSYWNVKQKKMFLKTWDISDANIQSFTTYFFYYLKKERKKKWSDRSKSIVLLTNVKKEVDQTSKHFKFPPYFQRVLRVFKEGNSHQSCMCNNNTSSSYSKITWNCGYKNAIVIYILKLPNQLLLLWQISVKREVSFNVFSWYS